MYLRAKFTKMPLTKRNWKPGAPRMSRTNDGWISGFPPFRAASRLAVPHTHSLCEILGYGSISCSSAQWQALKATPRPQEAPKTWITRTLQLSLPAYILIMGVKSFGTRELNSS